MHGERYTTSARSRTSLRAGNLLDAIGDAVGQSLADPPEEPTAEQVAPGDGTGIVHRP